MSKVTFGAATAALAAAFSFPALDLWADGHNPMFDFAARGSVVVAMKRSVDGRSQIVVEAGSNLGTDAPNPQIELGSISKFVTAVAILNLVESGQLSLNTPMSRLFGAGAGAVSDVTIHQLLTHTSGIIESTGDDFETLSRDAFIARVANSRLEAAPGLEHLYSNAGYSLLAAVIEQVSGKSYQAYLTEDVLNQGDIAQIGYQTVYQADSALRARPSLSVGLRRAEIPEASWGAEAPGWNLIGNGGLVTTSSDFLLFWTAFLDGEIVDDRLVKAALTPHADEGDGDSFYGYGLVVQDDPDLGRMYWHDGGNDIFSAEWRHLDALNLTLVVGGLGEDAFDAMEDALDTLR